MDISSLRLQVEPSGPWEATSSGETWKGPTLGVPHGGCSLQWLLLQMPRDAKGVAEMGWSMVEGWGPVRVLSLDGLVKLIQRHKLHATALVVGGELTSHRHKYGIGWYRGIMGHPSLLSYSFDHSNKQIRAMSPMGLSQT